MNIVLVTQVYLDPQGERTLRSSAVCHYWTKEWVKLGHRVKVIYCYPNYSRIFHFVKNICPNFISQFTNGTLTNYRTETSKYEYDGVEILRIPMRKFAPKIRYPEHVIQSILEISQQDFEQSSFEPDVIFSHFDNPILEIAGKLKHIWNVPMSFVLHGYPSDIKRLYPNEYQKMIADVDAWGFRSRSIKEDFESQYGNLEKSFIAYSGIPEDYISNLCNEQKKIDGKVCFVGALIKRKYPEVVLETMLPELMTGDMSLTFIGEGALGSKIKKIVNCKKLEKRVCLRGYLNRDEVQKELDASDIFVMISKHETFGMVYLEAMAHGCITIASRKEGFDGIIEDGVNGFLCEPGSKKSLRDVLDKIKNMSQQEKNAIRQSAMATAKKMTERKMAEMYLLDVKNILESGGKA